MWEHRASPRVPASGEVLLYLKGLPVASGEVRNVSRDGMFVAAGDASLSRNDYVELELQSAPAPTVRFPAMVVHCTAAGLGLIVDSDDERASQALQILAGGGSAGPH